MNRQQPDPIPRLFLLLLAIPVIWAAILAAPLLGEGLPGLLSGLQEINPVQLTWTADTPRIILLFLLAYGLGLLPFFFLSAFPTPDIVSANSTFASTV